MNKWIAGFMLAGTLYTMTATAPGAAEAAPVRWQPVSRPAVVVYHHESDRDRYLRERHEREVREARARWEREQYLRRERERLERERWEREHRHNWHR